MAQFDVFHLFFLILLILCICIDAIMEEHSMFYARVFSIFINTIHTFSAIIVDRFTLQQTLLQSFNNNCKQGTHETHDLVTLPSLATTVWKLDSIYFVDHA